MKTMQGLKVTPSYGREGGRNSRPTLTAFRIRLTEFIAKVFAMIIACFHCRTIVALLTIPTFVLIAMNADSKPRRPSASSGSCHLSPEIVRFLSCVTPRREWCIAATNRAALNWDRWREKPFPLV
jgi:hypothetical protein